MLRRTVGPASQVDTAGANESSIRDRTLPVDPRESRCIRVLESVWEPPLSCCGRALGVQEEGDHRFLAFPAEGPHVLIRPSCFEPRQQANTWCSCGSVTGSIPHQGMFPSAWCDSDAPGNAATLSSSALSAASSRMDITPSLIIYPGSLTPSAHGHPPTQFQACPEARTP